MDKVDRVFVDSNIWFSFFWGSKTIDKLINRLEGETQIVVSELVLEEVARNIELKLPGVLENVRNFFTVFPLMVVRDPELKDLKAVKTYCDIKDVPILTACLKSKCKFLITGNIKDFRVKKIAGKFGVKVITPLQWLKI